jgi:transposase
MSGQIFAVVPRLVTTSRRAKTAQALALRARIVLACADGADNKTVAQQLGVWPQTVGKWRARFVTDRLDGLADRSGRWMPRSTSRRAQDALADG